MARFRGIPFDSDRATFEAYEQRVEQRELARYLEEHHEEPDLEEER